MDCKLLEEHYEAFALGALEGEEYAEIRAHLARQCPSCTPGVERARAVVAELAYLAPEVDPPARVRHRLMAAVTEPAPQRRWLPSLGWAAAAAMLVLALLAGYQARQLQTRIAELESRSDELAAENETYRQVLAIISAAETRAVSLTAPESPQIHAYWNEPLGLVLAGQNLPQPAADRTYQLWVVPKQGNPVSAGIFRPEDEGRVLLISASPMNIADAAALAITDEPAGGVPQPTTNPIWVGPLG